MTDNNSNGPGRPPDPSTTLVTVAAAAASGLGVLGFVTLAGGAVLWRRFTSMGLPADNAVAVLPKAVLVTTGAEFLVPALLLSSLTVIVVVMVRILTTHDDASGTTAESPEAEPAGGDDGLHPFRWFWTQLTTHPASYFAGLTIFLVEGAVAATSSDDVSFWACVLLLAMAAASAVVVGVSFHVLKRNVGAVALIAFLAAGTFWVFRTYEKTLHSPTVIPMAYSRAQPGKPASVETGYMVAETSDRIWFASLPTAPSAGTFNELREFPRSETEDLEIGQLAAPAQAKAQAANFASNLCQRLISLTAATATTERTRKGKKAAQATPVVPVGCTT